MNTKQLKEKILSLAIQGKLVPQDSNDEPAIELLKRINPNIQSIVEDIPFEIPKGWCWCKINDIGKIVTGTTPPKDTKAYYDGNIPFFKPTDLEQGKHTCKSIDHLSKLGFEKSRQLPPMSILVTCIGATIGKTGLITMEGSCNQQINAIIPYKDISPLYVYYTCISDYFQNKIKINAPAVTLPILKKNKFIELTIPLPPLAEQHRIVEKVESLFTLIDNIEKNKESIKDNIKATRQKLLTMAIRGELVPQDPNDEPVIELLKRINPKFTPLQYGESLPQGWSVCKLKDIVNVMMGQSPKGETVNQTHGLEFHQGKICFTDKYLKQSNTYTTETLKVAEANSLLLCVRAPVGDINITNRKICIGRGLCAITPKEGDLLFFFYLLKTLKPIFESKATGSTFNAISKDIIQSEVISIPPLAEQRRIVVKLELLFAQLDDLEKNT